MSFMWTNSDRFFCNLLSWLYSLTDMIIEGQYCLSVGIQTGGDLLPEAVHVSPSAEWDIQAG